MFLLKKIIAPMLFPVPILVGIFVIGLFFLWFTKKQRMGKIIITIGFIALIILSYNFIPGLFIKNLEYQYPPVRDYASLSELRWIVVLGGGVTSDPNLSPMNQLSNPSLIRLVQGIQLHRRFPETRIILTGSGVFDPVSCAEVMKTVCRQMGVENQRLHTLPTTRDTEEEAQELRRVVGDKPFFLVTSASHIPRAMGLLKKMNMNPVAVPTDYIYKNRQSISPGMFFPGAGGFQMMQRVFYENLGMMWSKLRGRI